MGVTAAFALENLRQHHEDVRYRAGMIAALSTTFEDVAHHGKDIDRTISQKLQAFDAA